MQENYLSNWIQALFNSLPPEDYKNGVLVLGGDGRYFNCKASQIIIKIAAGNGVGKILVGREGIMSTPAVSAVIRKRKDNGGFIMSASHNPGGPEYDWGIKFNYSSGQPAPESITDKIYGNTLSISEIKMAEIPDADLSRIGITKACLISSSSEVFSRDQTSGDGDRNMILGKKKLLPLQTQLQLFLRIHKKQSHTSEAVLRV